MTVPSISFILDISRLLSRAGSVVPTGIDRVELAYAEYLLTHHQDQTYFVALSLTGRLGRLPRSTVTTFISNLLNGWNLGHKEKIAEAKNIAKKLKIYLFFPNSLPDINGIKFYFLVSHHHLMHKKIIRNFLSKTGSYFIPMVHDLIPIEYPEYSRPREKIRHKARIDSVIELARAVIVPTDSVRESLKPFFSQANRHGIPIWKTPHGVHKQAIYHTNQECKNYKYKKPYFVYISTIEPRKNHLLLLHLWRYLVQQRGEKAVPYLILIGKRGWENENILDLLERSPALQNLVIEESGLSDECVASLLRYSNGLLFPSFTEGYGLPLTEAMSLGVPSICSNIPALREIGQNIPSYVSPLDATEWEKIIDDFSQYGPLWQAQKERLKKWSPFSWSQSVALTLSHCLTLTQND